jgi:hypothetical protein
MTSPIEAAVANPRAYALAYAAGGVWFVVAIVALFAYLGAPASAEGAGVAVGRLLAGVAVGSGIVGYAARQSASRWRLWYYLVATLIAIVAVNLVAAYGRAGR